MQELTQLFTCLEQHLAWPEQTLTAGMYRLDCQVRKFEIDKRETQNAGFWDKAVTNSSALQAGLSRAQNQEIHQNLGIATGSIFV